MSTFRSQYKFVRLDDFHVQELVAMSLLEEMATKGEKTLEELYSVNANAKRKGGKKGAGAGGSNRSNGSAPTPTSTTSTTSTINKNELNDGAIDVVEMVYKSNPELDATQNTSLDCCICMSPFYRPVALRCGHKFCHPCLEKSVKEIDDRITADLFVKAVNGDVELETTCCVCRKVCKIQSRMHVLTVLCKESYPEEYSARTKELDEEFRMLMAQYLRNAGPTPCARGVNGDCIVM
jgi:hypothetical protein